MKRLLMFCLLFLMMNGLKAQSNEKPDTTKHVFEEVSCEAAFPGAINTFYRYIYKRIEFPKNYNFVGKILVKFIVGENGKIIDAQIIESAASDKLNKEILRVFNSSPKWKPAQQNGYITKETFNMTLNLDTDKGLKKD